MTTPFDYVSDPDRFRLAVRVTRQHLLAARSLYDQLAEMLVGIDARHIWTSAVAKAPCGRRYQRVKGELYRPGVRVWRPRSAPRCVAMG